MSTAKIAITIDAGLLSGLDRLVKKHIFPNRSQAIQTAVKEKLDHINHSRLARECAKLNPGVERQMAEEGMGTEIQQWPDY